MGSPDQTGIKAVLKATTLKDCLAWFDQTQDQHVLAALGPLLFDAVSSEVRRLSDETLRVELFALAMKDSALRSFLERKYQASLDRITARYLDELL